MVEWEAVVDFLNSMELELVPNHIYSLEDGNSRSR